MRTVEYKVVIMPTSDGYSLTIYRPGARKWLQDSLTFHESVAGAAAMALAKSKGHEYVD